MKKPEDYGITDYEWKDGRLDVYQNVNLLGLKLSKIPFNFGTVYGNFNCSKNKLKSLEGSPAKVEGDFFCSWNKLTSLKGSPSKVNGFFWVTDNKLTILDGSHIEVTQGFAFRGNPIKEIKSAPKCKKLITNLSKEQIGEMIRIGINKEKLRIKMNIFR